MTKRVSLILILILISVNFCFANVIPIKLEEMIKKSDYIIVGKVTKVELIKGEKYAEVQVFETLKGNPNVSQIYYSASPSWICDSTNAEIGETALYFLRTSLAKGESVSKLPKRLAALLQGEPLYGIEHSGRGRMIPQNIEGQNYLFAVRDNDADVIFPENIEIARRVYPNNPNMGYARLVDVLSFIKRETTANK
jgi:hypothetical protein